MMPTTTRSTPCADSGTRAPTMNCAQNSPNRYPGLSEVEREVRHDRDREEGLGRREEQLLPLHVADRQAVGRRAGDREHDRERPDEERPLVHLRGHQCSEARVRVQTPREQAGDEKLRRLRRERREPLHQEELADVELLPRRDQGFGEGVREEPDHHAGRREEADHRSAAGGTGNEPRYLAGPTRCGSSAGALETRHV